MSLDVLEATDVGAYLTTEFAFQRKFLYRVAERSLLLRAQLCGLLALIDAELGEYGDRARATDAVNSGERYLKTFFRYGDSSDAKHDSKKMTTLSLGAAYGGD